MMHAKGRFGKVEHPVIHLTCYVRPTKKAIHQFEIESKLENSRLESESSQGEIKLSESSETKNDETKNEQKKGWWPWSR